MNTALDIASVSNKLLRGTPVVDEMPIGTAL